MNNPITSTAALIGNSKALRSLKTVLTVFLTFLTIWGVVGFGLFILEESSQVLMFSQWAAADVNRWDIILEGTDLMTKTNNTSKTINKYFGWVNPISYMSYKAYTDATDIFIASAIAKVFANDPSLFIGRTISFKFTPTRTENLASGNYKLTNRNLHVFSKTSPGLSGSIQVSGVLTRDGRQLIVDMTK
jgi:hypothetical protein